MACLTITTWKFFRIVVHMQNNLRITRLECLEICAKIKYKTLDTKQTYYTSNYSGYSQERKG